MNAYNEHEPPEWRRDTESQLQAGLKRRLHSQDRDHEMKLIPATSYGLFGSSQIPAEHRQHGSTPVGAFQCSTPGGLCHPDLQPPAHSAFNRY